MEGLIITTQSSDTKSKLAALEQLLAKLQRSSTLADVSNDVKFRLMSNCANLMKDANPKVAVTALDVVEICIVNSFAVFQPLSNMVFDLLIAKFGDIKLATRTRATDTMIALINAVGLSTALEKLLPHLNHRVWRVREQVLAVLMRVVQIYGEDILAAPDLPRQLSGLLADPQSSVRQLAMDVLCDLYNIFGESMMADLEAAGTRPSQIKLIQQTIDSRGGRSRDTPSSDVASIDIPSEVDRQPTASKTPRGLSSTSRPRSSSRGPAAGAPHLTRAISEPLEDRPTKSSQQSRVSGTGGFGRAAALGATAPIRSSTQGGREASDASPKEFNPNTPSSVAKKFSPDYFLSILGDGPSLSRNTGLVLYTERDLAGECATIVEGLMKPSDHWEDRMAALERLQGLICMDAADFDTFPSILKGMHEQVSIQVTDLRSTVSKEGCRTVAILANRMGNAFGPFAELWFPTLLKVVSVKISVISSAADRAARTVLYSMAAGAPRVVPILTECCAVKNPIIRKFGFEYCCIAFARWKQEYFDKHFSGFLKVLISGIGDADPGVRKGARLLFWVIHARGGSWKTSMTNLMKDLDSNAQRHVRSEESSATDDLADLFRKPDTCFPVDNYYTCGSNVSSTPPLVSTTGDKSAASKSSTTRMALEKPALSTNSTKEKPRALPDSKAPEPAPGPTSNAAANGAMGLPVRVNSGSAKTSAATAAPLAFSGDQPDNMAPPVMSLAAAREIRENRTGSRRLSVATCSSGGLSSADRGIGSKDISTPGNSGPLSGSRRMSIGPTSTATRSASLSTVEKEPASALTNGPKRIVRQGFSASQKPPTGVPSVEQAAALPEVKEPGARTDSPHELREGTSRGSAKMGSSEANVGASADCDSATDDGSSIDLSVHDDNENIASTANSSLNELRQMTADPLWDVRQKALLEIKRRVGLAFPPYYYKDGLFLGPAAKKNRKATNAAAVDGAFGKQLTTEFVEGIVDMTLAKIGDPHNRVAMTALDCIYLLVFPMEGKRMEAHDNGNSYVLAPVLEATSALVKLGYMMPALFARLADRRSKIRDKANEILNNIKASYDPNILIAALSPRLCEVSDRVRTAVVQFLLTIAALCEPFFRNPSNTHIFLSRMAHLMGSGGAMTPSTAFLLTGKRLLELVYKTTPQVMLSQIAGLPLLEQVTIKKNLSALVTNIDAAVTAASKVEWNRMNSSDGGTVRNSAPTRESQSKSPAFPIANLDTTTDSDVRQSPSMRNSSRSNGNSPNRYSSPHGLDDVDDAAILDEVASPLGSLDSSDINDISESSMYAPIDGDMDLVENRSGPAQNLAPRSPHILADAKVSPSPEEKSGYIPVSPQILSRQPASPVESRPPPPAAPSSDSRKTPTTRPDTSNARSSPHVSTITSPHLAESRDIVWLLRTLSGTEFSLNVDERKDAIAELKTLIKQGTDAFWSRNFAQIISVLLDAFSPVTSSERSVSAKAASGAEEYTFLSETVNSITGLSPPPNMNLARSSRGHSGAGADGAGSMSKAHTNDRNQFESQLENMSASEYNNVRENRPNRAESKSPGDLDEGEEQMLRMEFLHNVCRALLLIVRHRSRDAKNFLELMTCRLCEAAAYLPLALTMQCEQILGMACPLGAQGVAKALAPYCSYGNGSVSVAGLGDDVSNGLPPPPDPSFASSPTSAVRRLALRVLALCVPNMTSRELVSILPLLMTHTLPSFRSPLVDIRQAVVGAIVQMYVLVGDVLHPYVKELPPQQKKLLTIYIDRQLKSQGSKNTVSTTAA